MSQFKEGCKAAGDAGVAVEPVRGALAPPAHELDDSPGQAISRSSATSAANLTGTVVDIVPRRAPVPWLALAQRLRGSVFAADVASVGGATVLARAISLLALGYPARKLGPAGYGTVGFALSLSAYAAILLSPGLTTWGMREIARDRSSAARTLIIVNVAQLALATFAYALLALYAAKTAPPMQRTAILLVGIGLFNTALMSDWALNGMERTRMAARFGVLLAAFTVAALFAFVHAPRDLFRYALIAPLAGIAVSGCTYAYLFGKLRLRWSWPSPRQFGTALRSSIPLGAVMALVTVLHYANHLIVKAYLGTAALGLFLAAFNLLAVAGTIPGVLLQVFLPRLARLDAAGDVDRAAREARAFAFIHMACGFLIGAIFVAEAPAIVHIVYGSRYLAAVVPLRWMGMAVVFNFAICGYTNCLISYGRDRVMLAAVSASAVVAVGGGWLLVPRMGILGAAVTVGCIDLAGWLVSLPSYRRLVGTLQFRGWIRPACGAAAVILISRLLQPHISSFWLRCPVAASSYVPFVLAELRGVLA